MAGIVAVELSESEKIGNAQLAAYLAFKHADEMWSAKLQKAFGKRAGDARYTKQGHGEEGSALRAAHDGFVAARKAWNVAYGRED